MSDAAMVNPYDMCVESFGLSALSMMADTVRDFRNEALTDEFDNIVVDTVCPSDTCRWETGIQRDGKPWVIVEQYVNEDAAHVGHAKWRDLLKADRDVMLTDTFIEHSTYASLWDDDFDEE